MVVLCPSLMEGWALSVAEGLAHGKPVLCSDRGGIAEASMNVATVLDPTDWVAWRDMIQATANARLCHAVPAGLTKWDTTADSVCLGLLTLGQMRGAH
jgi:hypothetical protein